MTRAYCWWPFSGTRNDMKKRSACSKNSVRNTLTVICSNWRGPRHWSRSIGTTKPTPSDGVGFVVPIERDQCRGPLQFEQITVRVFRTEFFEQAERFFISFLVPENGHQQYARVIGRHGVLFDDGFQPRDPALLVAADPDHRRHEFI